MKPSTDTAQAIGPKPAFALFLATGFGLGYIPKAPGTFGALLGVALVLLTNSSIAAHALWRAGIDTPLVFGRPVASFVLLSAVVFLIVVRFGVSSASQVASFVAVKDPQFVVIDEVSGQHLTLLLGGGLLGLLNWKLLLAGFILFRVFDIWKPFPVRQAELLPSGWGIMADDWVAAVYAALGLWVLRWLGL